jgi:L-alanine-DL-glutamate epimerase-like enolase superfamily enzyme
LRFFSGVPAQRAASSGRGLAALDALSDDVFLALPSRTTMPDVTIERVDTVALRIPYDHWAPKPTFGGIARETMDCLLVRVTASNGMVGWGEAFWGGWQATQAAIEHWVAPLAKGQSVTDVPLTARFERALHNFGRSGAYVYALAGLDIALWDLRGKIEGKPVCALLGGKKRDKVEVYASLLAYGGKLDDVARNTARALERGYRQIKLHEKTTEAVAVSREAAGAKTPLMVDTNCAWLPADAHDAVMAMKPYDPLWVEEPIWPAEDVDALGTLREATGVPLAAGENATGTLEFARLVAAGIDYVQPSAVKHGLTAQWEICRKAEDAGATCVPHSPYFGPGYLATLHILAAKQKEVALERFFCDLAHVPYGKSVPIENGVVQIPDLPGLGPAPDEELLTRFKL